MATFSGKMSTRIEPSVAGLSRTWVAETVSIVDGVSTGSSGECRLNETGTALRSGAEDWMPPSVPRSVTGADEAARVVTVSLALGSPLKSLDKRVLNPNFNERPEETDLTSLASLGP